MIRNLLEETIDSLKLYGKSIRDVKWVGTRADSMSWEAFADVANKDYDNGYGTNYVCLDLMVVGDNWWLERFEYDGSELWQFKTLPTEEIANPSIPAEMLVWENSDYENF